MSNGEDDRYRSRKWRLAIASLTLGTLATTIMEVAAFALIWRGLITEEIWFKGALAFMYWWLFVDATVLSGYGIANVIEKWAPKSG